MSETGTSHAEVQDSAANPNARVDGATDESSPRSGARTHRRSRVQLAGFAVAGLLLLTVGAGGGAFAARQLQAANVAPAEGSPSASTIDGSDRVGPGTGSRSGGGVVSHSETAATDAQTAGVVTITTQLGYQSGAAAGTGVILTSAGEILTNNHVVTGATSITVTDPSTSTPYTATVVGTDPTDDIAVLQLKGASGLHPARLSTVPAGAADTVTAIGNGTGTGTLTSATGTVTDLNQTITTQADGGAASETLHGLIQIDARVVAGDSGGPLTSSTGAVVGIDTAASSGTRQVTAYAIPIAAALSIVHQIHAGMSTSTITIGYPAFLGVEIDRSSTSDGAAIAAVLDGTPAASAGLVTNDAVTAVDGAAIHSGEGLTSILKTHTAGDTVTITWTTPRGDTRSAQVTLTEGPAN